LNHELSILRLDIPVHEVYVRWAVIISIKAEMFLLTEELEGCIQSRNSRFWSCFLEAI